MIQYDTVACTCKRNRIGVKKKMKFNVDSKYLIDCFKETVAAPSPSEYYVKLNPVLKAYAESLGLEMTFDRRNNAYITLEGEDNSKSVLVAAHADTVGLMVRTVEANGTLRVRSIGGINFATLDGETVTVHTRDGKDYTGIFLCQSYSTHVFADALTLERSDNTMMILLDERVRSKEDVKALGICPGDFVSIDPRCQITENGFVKSRFIDDKGAIACCFASLKYMKENGLKPKHKTIFQFSYSEEIGFGGCHIPAGISEMVAIDIGLVGPELEGSEYSVSICAKDTSQVYDYDMTSKLIALAKKAECDYAVDLYFRYGSDVGVAKRAGNDIKGGLFGMAVYGSHGMERTHIDGLLNTSNLLLAYILDI